MKLLPNDLCWHCVRMFATGARNFSQKQRPPFNILFFGTDSFAVETLKALHLNRSAGSDNPVVKSLQVVSTSSKSHVARFAVQNDLDLLTWPLDPGSLDLYDLGVLVSFGKLVPRKVISAFPYGILNVHPSLLPRWRGASPLIHTVLAEDAQTAVSIMSIQPNHFDTGPIVQQETFPVPVGCTAESLSQTLAKEGAGLLMQTLKGMPAILQEARPQSNEGATYAHKASPALTVIDWHTHTSQQVKLQYRALAHMLPLRTTWKDQPIKLQDCVLETSEDFTPSVPTHTKTTVDLHNADPGTVVYDELLQYVCVKCLNGWVAFGSVTLKKTMMAADFYNGYLSKDKFKVVHFASENNGLFGQQYWDWVQQKKAKEKKSRKSDRL